MRIKKNENEAELKAHWLEDVAHHWGAYPNWTTPTHINGDADIVVRVHLRMNKKETTLFLRLLTFRRAPTNQLIDRDADGP